MLRNLYYVNVNKYSTIYILIILIFFIACSDSSDAEKTEEFENFPVQQLDSTSIVFTVEGKQNATLFAEHLYKFSDNRLTKAENITIDFTGRSKDGDGVLYADSGKMHEDQSMVHVFGNVVLKSESGGNLRTNSLSWNTKSNRVFTDDYVVIVKDGEKIEGKGLETDVGFDKVIIKEQVIAELEGSLE